MRHQTPAGKLLFIAVVAELAGISPNTHLHTQTQTHVRSSEEMMKNYLDKKSHIRMHT